LKQHKDVFPEEILGLPPRRNIYFTIDLLHGVVLVSKAPLRKSILELMELKIQLQELLNKKYIRPSMSPWVHQFYLSRRNMGHSGFINHKQLNKMTIKKKYLLNTHGQQHNLKDKT